LEKLRYGTVALVSFATIWLELVQTRILSFIFWNHLVYLTLSIALLGFGISGTLTAILLPKISNPARHLAGLLILFAASTQLALFATHLLPVLGTNIFVLRVLFCYVIYLFPFIFAGSILSIIFSESRDNLGKLYAADLVCAGSACIVFFLLLQLLTPDRSIGLITLFIGLLAFAWAKNTSKALRLSAIAVAEIGFLIAICSSFFQVPYITEPYKELYAYLGSTKGAFVEMTAWTPICRIDVTDLGVNGKEITQDGSAHTFVQSKASVDKTFSAIKNHTDMYPGTMAWEVKKNPDVAIIGVGGGIDIVNALGYNSKSIVSAEINPATYDIVTHRYADYNGHFTADPRVTPLNEEGRSMLKQQSKKFDIIQAIGVDSFAALTSGAYVLSENYLYTVESFEEMFKHLRPDGIISFGRINSSPPKESMRLVSLASEALRRAGCHRVSKQIFVFLTPNDWAVCLFRNGPFTAEELRVLKKAAESRQLPILYFPKVLSAEEQASLEKAYYTSANEKTRDARDSFNAMIAAYDKGEEKTFFQSYPYLLTPTTDDSPFFFEYQKNPFEIPNLLELRGNAANVTLYVVIIESVIATLFAIFLPLLFFNRKGMLTEHAAPYSLYFAAIGSGFMLIEIALMQKCVLFLGNPLYSLPIVLSSLLISAGVGSFLVGQRALLNVRKNITIFSALLLLVLLLITFQLNSLFYSLIHIALPIRMFIVSILIVPAGLLMGTFFPLGLRCVGKTEAAYIPWAWGINGCASVYGSFAAILLAIWGGFTTALLCGAALYLIASLCALRFTKINS
jgi:spermidine synthase